MFARATPLRSVSSLLILGVGAIHFQQYVDFMSVIPTIGALFLLNAAGAAGIAVALLSRERLLRIASALAGLGLVAGALVSVLIALQGNIFGYSEPTLRFPVALAIVLEALTIPALIAVLRSELHSATSPR